MKKSSILMCVVKDENDSAYEINRSIFFYKTCLTFLFFIFYFLNNNAGNNKVTREYIKGINAHTELHYYIN